MKGLAEKERERKKIPTHCNITYYLYSLWKTGLKHRILICQKIRMHKHTFYCTGQTKNITEKRPYFLSTQRFSWQMRLSVCCLHSCQEFASSLSTEILIHTLAPHPLHKQLNYVATISLKRNAIAVAITYHLHNMISLVMFKTSSIFGEYWNTHEKLFLTVHGWQ